MRSISNNLTITSTLLLTAGLCQAHEQGNKTDGPIFTTRPAIVYICGGPNDRYEAPRIATRVAWLHFQGNPEDELEAGAGGQGVLTYFADPMTDDLEAPDQGGPSWTYFAGRPDWELEQQIRRDWQLDSPDADPRHDDLVAQIAEKLGFSHRQSPTFDLDAPDDPGFDYQDRPDWDLVARMVEEVGFSHRQRPTDDLEAPQEPGFGYQDRVDWDLEGNILPLPSLSHRANPDDLAAERRPTISPRPYLTFVIPGSEDDLEVQAPQQPRVALLYFARGDEDDLMSHGKRPPDQDYDAPDEDEVDCDGNGLSDLREIIANPRLDMDDNRVLDSCEDMGDFNFDGVVDVMDLITLLTQWGSCDAQVSCEADLNHDGVVDVRDLVLLISQWQ